MSERPVHQEVHGATLVKRDLDRLLSGALHHYVALHHTIETLRWEMEHATQEHVRLRYRFMLEGDPLRRDGGAEQELKDLALVIAAAGTSAEEPSAPGARTESETRAESSAESSATTEGPHVEH
jgi:hypothetical protein